jgi:hypothetical protein
MRRLFINGPALWLVLILLVVEVVRIRLLSIPLERDEGEYAYAGQLMLEGEPPYHLIYNMKMPGIYAAYAVIMALFGQSAEGIHLGFMLVNMAAIVLLYFVGRRFLQPAGAVAASAAYALLSLSPQVLGFNAHATHFVVLAALGGLWLLLRAQERAGRAGFFWSGTLFGAAFLMKQPGGAFACFGGAAIAWAAWRRHPREWKADALRLALYAAGAAAPIVLTGLVLWRAGVWDKFWFWTVTFARLHATTLPWGEGRIRLASFFTSLRWEWMFWGLAAAGLGVLLVKKGRADEKFFFLALLFCSVAAVCPRLYFSQHYFVLMLPVVALLAAKAFDEAALWLAAQPKVAAASPLFNVPQTSKSAVPQVSKPADRRQTWKSAAQQVWKPAARNIGWILFGLVWAGIAWSHLDPFLLSTPENVAVKAYPVNDFAVYPVIADYLARHAPPTATLAVLGSEPELLFYAHRRSVTGYIYMYDLVQDQPFRSQMAEEMMTQVEQGRADYVVFVNQVLSWLPNPMDCFDQIRSWLMTYTQSEYVPYGVVTFAPNQYVWGPDCLRQVPLGHRFVVIFQRKPAAGLPKSAP